MVSTMVRQQAGLAAVGRGETERYETGAALAGRVGGQRRCRGLRKTCREFLQNGEVLEFCLLQVKIKFISWF